MTLPRKTTQKNYPETTQKQDIDITPVQKGIIDFLLLHPYAGRKEISSNLGSLSEDGVKYNLKILQQKGVIKRIGPAKGGYCVGLLEDTSAQRTVHKAKGDEFDNVLVIFTDEKALKVLLKPDIQNYEPDRVYYVAMSIALNRLFLTVPSLSTKVEEKLRNLPIEIGKI